VSLFRIVHIYKAQSFSPVESDTFKINITVKHTQNIGHPMQMPPAQKNTGKVPNQLVTSWFKHTLVGPQLVPSPRARMPALRMGVVGRVSARARPCTKKFTDKLKAV